MAARRRPTLAAVPPVPVKVPADDLLNSTVCVDVENFNEDLANAVMQAAKLTRLLNLALIGLIHQERHTGSMAGDLELLQEVAYGAEHSAGAAERLQGRRKEPDATIAARRSVGGSA